MTAIQTHFSEVAYESPEYRQTLALREAVLRRPLGLSLSVDDLAHEADERHFVLLDRGEVVACVVARPLDDEGGQNTWRLRQMAVTPQQQRQGHGRRLLLETLSTLRAANVAQVLLHAREESAGFYRGVGFLPYGEAFLEIGIPHQAMQLSFAQA